MPDSFVHEHDVTRLLEILEDAHAWQSDDFFYASVLDELAELVAADVVGFQVNAWARGWLSLEEVAGGQRVVWVRPDVPLDDPFLDWDGCAGLADRFGYTGVTSSSEVRRGRRDSELMGFMAPIGDLDRRVLFHRHGGPDFSDREVTLLRLARPHLAELHLRRRAELGGLPSLTRRQWEILRLVATGATNHRIAHRLGISEGTVRKHLENAFARLHVSSRTEAVSRLDANL
jgi:DNA-binding CsgD family transcriptional regulator